MLRCGGDLESCHATGVVVIVGGGVVVGSSSSCIGSKVIHGHRFEPRLGHTVLIIAYPRYKRRHIPATLPDVQEDNLGSKMGYSTCTQNTLYIYDFGKCSSGLGGPVASEVICSEKGRGTKFSLFCIKFSFDFVDLYKMPPLGIFVWSQMKLNERIMESLYLSDFLQWVSAVSIRFTLVQYNPYFASNSARRLSIFLLTVVKLRNFNLL
jgi:hypothetical protein